MQILVVDDLELLANRLARSLRREGHDVMVATTPTQAKEVLVDRGVDLHMVVVDYALAADETGIDVLSFARARFPHIGRILMSASTMLTVAAGTDLYAFLAKPFRREDLLRLIQTVSAANRGCP